MNKQIKEALKKTPLAKAYWKVLKLPGIRSIRKVRREKRKDVFLFRDIPHAYEAGLDKPVNEKKVLFIEYRSDHITDNMKRIYEQLKKLGGYELHAHYMMNSFVERKEYEKRCKKMMADLADAKYVFIDEANEVLSAVNLRPETVVVQLWHACGAFKKFGMSTADLIFGGDAKAKQRHPAYKNLSYVTVSSPEVIWAYAEAMELEDRKEIIKPVGVSRTDVFFDRDALRAARGKVCKVFPAAKDKKIILYAPTFRGRVATAKAPDCFDYQKFYEAFGEDYVIIAKHHPYVRKLPEIPQELNGTFAYDATHTLEIDELLMVSDICISDYSSLIFEYSLFNRPMIFFAYDLENYGDWRGFYYPYEEMTPGPVCRTNEEMIDWISDLEKNFDRARVEAFRERFMSGCDGHATERILQMAMGLPKTQEQ